MASGGELKEIYFEKAGLNLTVYPFNLPFFKTGDRLKFHDKVTFFVGENGTGKSSLIEAIAVASGFNAEGGTKNFSFNTRASHSVLHKYIRLSRGTKRHTDGYFLRSESFFNVATEIERLDAEEGGGPSIIGSYGGRSLHEQSHGEAFWALFMNRFGDNGFYLLDEPEAALSPNRQLAMLYKLHQLAQSGSQFIIATHSPILITYPDSLVYEFGNEGITQKHYRETQLFTTYLNFLQDSEKQIRYLLRE